MIMIAGAFRRNSSHWQPPQLRQRDIDVAFLARNMTGMQSLLHAVKINSEGAYAVTKM